MDTPEKRKIIFLDIDGALASTRVDMARRKGMHEFDPIAVSLISDLCVQNDAQVVIISTWAGGNRYTRESLLEYFQKAGFTGDFAQDWIIDDPSSRDRTTSIQRYLTKHDLSLNSCIVIDDEKPPASKKHFAARWVSPMSMYNGFLYQDYLRANSLLSECELTEDERHVVNHANGKWKAGGRGV